ncbi:MAG: response regulator [Elusimicrobia bacterium]|nr:response regulator [Elusimicrobiota bacterium]
MLEAPHPAPDSGPAAAGTEPSVLVVDDHPGNRLAVEAVIRDLGVPTVGAESGSEALKRVLEREFAVILLDVQMPGMDGFETASLIRQSRAAGCRRCPRTPSCWPGSSRT